MRILWVASQLEGHGGIGRVVARGTRALAERGHEVHVAGPATHADLAPFTRVVAHPWPERFPRLLRALHFLPLARRLAPDVVHFHAALPHDELILPARALRFAIGRPLLVATPHGSRPYRHYRTRLGARLADLVVVPSEWAAELPRAAGARHIEVVPGGVELGPEPDFEKREPVVLVLARLVESKGIDVLLDAFEAVAATRPAWQLWIAGDGPDRDALVAHARALACTARVRFLGWLDGAEKRRVVSCAAIGVLPSRRESFGGALLEMQERGVACIASDAGGTADLASGGAAARLVPPDDVDALTAAVAELIDDAAARRALAGAGRRHAERFGWDAIAARYEAVYTAARP
jgi:glycosyltransferase involved in cell wall biosynthesis